MKLCIIIIKLAIAYCQITTTIAIKWTSIVCIIIIKLVVVYYQITIKTIKWTSILCRIIIKLAIAYFQITITTIKWTSIFLCRIIIKMATVYCEITITTIKWTSMQLCRIITKLAVAYYQITIMTIKWTPFIPMIIMEIAVLYNKFYYLRMDNRLTSYWIVDYLETIQLNFTNLSIVHHIKYAIFHLIIGHWKIS